MLAVMPRRSDSQMQARREEILFAARGVFARHGFEGATVRRLEEETGLSRGAIFHHFADKDALFLAVAQDEAAATADVVAARGVVGVMRDLADADRDWLGVRLEVARRLRTDTHFRGRWRELQEPVRRAALDRVERGQAAGTVRDDVSPAVLVSFLTLMLDGLTDRLVTDGTVPDLPAVLDLAERAVRPRAVHSHATGPAEPAGQAEDDSTATHDKEQP